MMIEYHLEILLIEEIQTKLFFFLPVWLSNIISINGTHCKNNWKQISTTISIYNLPKNNVYNCTKAKPNWDIIFKISEKQLEVQWYRKDVLILNNEISNIQMLNQ